MRKVHLKTLSVTTEPLPLFLHGLMQESLNDLSWTDKALGVSEFGFWEEVDVTPPFDNLSTYDGTEVLTADAVTKTVNVVRGVRLKTDDELLAEFKDTVPTSLKMAQCRAQLIIDGKDDDVEALIDSTEDLVKKKLYRAYWEYEPLVLRDNAMINEMAPLLNIDLDEFFINASKL